MSGATLTTVFQATSAASGNHYVTSTDVGGFQFGYNGSTWVGGFAGATFTINSITTDTNWHHVVIVFDGTQTGNANRVKVRLDGVETTLTFSGSANSLTSSSAGYFFGGSTGTSSNNTSSYFQGYMGETLIWTRALNVAEQLAVETYLANKWAI